MGTGRTMASGGSSPAVLAGALAVLAAVTLDVLLGGPLTALDRVLSDLMVSTRLPEPGWDRPGQMPLDQLVNFGDRDVVVSILLVALAVLCWRSRTLVPLARLAVLGLLVVLTVYGLKVGIGRPAPDGLLPPGAVRSYPSGHTATAVVLWGLLAGLAAEYPSSGLSQRVTAVLSWLGPLLTMSGMLIRDYHWFSDLIGGAALGAVLLQAERLALRHWRGARRGNGRAGDRSGGGPAVDGPPAVDGAARGEPDPAGRADARLGGGS